MKSINLGISRPFHEVPTLESIVRGGISDTWFDQWEWVSLCARYISGIYWVIIWVTLNPVCLKTGILLEFDGISWFYLLKWLEKSIFLVFKASRIPPNRKKKPVFPGCEKNMFPLQFPGFQVFYHDILSCGKHTSTSLQNTEITVKNMMWWWWLGIGLYERVWWNRWYIMLHPRYWCYSSCKFLYIYISLIKYQYQRYKLHLWKITSIRHIYSLGPSSTAPAHS
jgi:hypothetical protein